LGETRTGEVGFGGDNSNQPARQRDIAIDLGLKLRLDEGGLRQRRRSRLFVG
jgi:hypothetical protein